MFHFLQKNQITQFYEMNLLYCWNFSILLSIVEFFLQGIWLRNTFIEMGFLHVISCGLTSLQPTLRGSDATILSLLKVHYRLVTILGFLVNTVITVFIKMA